jgi:hypothetical protein
MPQDAGDRRNDGTLPLELDALLALEVRPKIDALVRRERVEVLFRICPTF